MGLEVGAIAAIASVAIPALIGVGKQLFDSGPGTAGGISQAGAEKIHNMQQAAAAYGAYRPQVANARMKAMEQQMSAYQGAGNMMQAMYGGGGKADMGGYTPGGGGYTKPTIPDLPPPPPPGPATGTGGGGWGPGTIDLPPSNPRTPDPWWKQVPVPQTPGPFDPTRPGWGNEPDTLVGNPAAFAPPPPNQLAALLAAEKKK